MIKNEQDSVYYDSDTKEFALPIGDGECIYLPLKQAIAFAEFIQQMALDEEITEMDIPVGGHLN